MIPLRTRIVVKAREYLGTPWHHQGRVKGAGVDCVGLVVCVARELGLADRDCIRYPRYPMGSTLLDELRSTLTEIPITEVGVGDVAVFWVSLSTRLPQHIGILSPVGIIHTWEHTNTVVEMTLGSWRRRMCHAFRFPQVIEEESKPWQP